MARAEDLNITEPFLNDLDKMYDLLTMFNYEEFHTTYDYIGIEAYYNTCHLVEPSKVLDEMSEENQKVVENLANLMREAENLHIENMNGRPTVWSVTGDELKIAVSSFVFDVLTEDQLNLFQELCSAMGV